MNELLAFFAVSALVIVTPGQDTALTIRNTLVGGRGAGVRTAFGVACGQACWTVSASVGIAALLVASEPVFRAVRLAGAAYLVWLGAQSLWAAWRGAQREHVSPRRAAPFRQGLLSNLANPKMAVFFTSLLPQFGGTSLAALLALGLVFCTMTFVWLSNVARVGETLRPFRRAIDAVTGAVLVALGLRVATDRR